MPDEGNLRTMEAGLVHHLHDIVARRQLTALLQPLVQMDSGEILGYEGLIRGPSDSPLHSPLNLFKAARSCGMTVQVEHLCRRVVLERFAELDLPGKLFLNVSPESLLQRDARHGQTMDLIRAIGISPERVIIELTENEPTLDYGLMREAVLHYRDMGFRIAIDDLGEGFSSLRLWSELRPDYVKIDMHFIQGINCDPVKLQFVRSIQEIAEQSNTLVIAEGIETQAELLVLRDLGVRYGQGYHLGRPLPTPATALPAEVMSALGRRGVAVYPHAGHDARQPTVAGLVQTVAAVAPETTNDALYQRFAADRSLAIVPVVTGDGVPLGLVNRYDMIEQYARPYQRELSGRKPCTTIMDADPIIVDKHATLQELSLRLASSAAHHLHNGFIVTDHGRYVGMGRSQDLMREITQLQILAARYANPLTQLPGNVPINEHVERLLASGARFWICYADLDHFKPFNDVYGYRKGDDVIQLTGALLRQQADADRDFVGHIGGDDFIVVFQSEDWERRCHAVLDGFASAIGAFYSDQDRADGGYLSEDRQGRKVFHPLMALSLGVAKFEPHYGGSHHEVARAASDAKKQAKKIPGHSLFIDRRQAPSAAGAPAPGPRPAAAA
ncbi:MAG TPA: GGDEF domain-containing protein [Telluria sp.]|nr:GGDEF domain-containing protein [Telluria sp.]